MTGLAQSGGGSADIEQNRIARAVERANPNALRLALYQLTGDQALSSMRVTDIGLRGGAMVIPVLARDHHAEVRDRAAKWLYGRAAGTPPTPPTNEAALALLQLFGAPPESNAAGRLALEELGFGEDRRATDWTSAPDPHELASATVTIIGTGISGIAAAIRLSALGLPVTLIERQAGFGGTWRWNDYPGARVDVPTQIYQFKREDDWDWPRPFATQPELLAYLESRAAKYDLRHRTRFGTEVVAATWVEASAEWCLTLRDKDGDHEHRTRFLISAAGLFSTARLPDIAGLESFAGPVMHTTDWDHGVDLSGRRVALIGTGSSGAQLMPRIATVAARLSVFQRTPNWVMPLPAFDAPHSSDEAWLAATLPFYRNWAAYATLLIDRQTEALQELDPDWIAAGGQVNARNDALRAYLEKHVHTVFADRPDLIAKSIPGYAPAARRLVVDNGWYDALLRPNVDLVTTSIARVDTDAIITADGVCHVADAIILGSGFATSEYLSPVRYTGREGATPAALWAADGARAHLGLTVPGFPNLFMFYGPNGQPRAGGFHAWADMWSRYVAKAIVKTVESGAASIEVRRDAFDRSNAALDAAMERLIWGRDGAGSYYLNAHGRSQVNMPWRADEYFAMIETPNFDEFIFA